MSESSFPEVRLAAVAITRGGSFLTVFNARWGGFTLPMSKRRTWSDPNVSAEIQEEEPQATAVRAAAEVLGRPLGPDELPRPLGLDPVGPFHQSGRDGTWKRYQFDVFQLELAPGEVPAPSGGGAVAWLTVEEMELAQPVSPTALTIARSIRGESILRGGA